MTLRLFSYGTLQMPKVQRALFGRLLEMEDDALAGWRIVDLPAAGPDPLDYSGLTVHKALVPGDPGDLIPGKVLTIDDRDWPALDAYEGDDYSRVEAVLASGQRAWVYILAPAAMPPR
jgi:hypothetical protein